MTITPDNTPSSGAGLALVLGTWRDPKGEVPRGLEQFFSLTHVHVGSHFIDIFNLRYKDKNPFLAGLQLTA